MSDISDRLRRIRAWEGASLRDFAEALKERAAYDVTRDSVRRYEGGETRVPAEYLAAVSRAFGVSASWLLLGTGTPSPVVGSVVERAFEEVARIAAAVKGLGGGPPEAALSEIVTAEWERVTRGLPPDHRLRDAILESWIRSRDAGVDRDGEGPFRRITAAELRRRREARKELVRAAGPHLEWLSTAVSHVPHVAYVVCREGIVLEAVTKHPDLLDRWGLHPGHDWSEDAMGTNGAGTALASGRVVAVLGPEHYLRAAHGCSCLAAPIRDPSGEMAGAVDLSLSFDGWRPERLVLSAYAAEMIEKELEDGGGGRSSDRR